MNIRKLGKIMNQKLDITGSVDPDNLSNVRWVARFEGGEIKEGCILSSTYGRGKTPRLALRDYAKNITGKTIVFNAYSEKDRDTFVVPDHLTT